MTICQQLDGLVMWRVVGTVTTRQGHPAYYAVEGDWPEMLAASGRPY
jgi:hypothetical protein